MGKYLVPFLVLVAVANSSMTKAQLSSDEKPVNLRKPGFLFLELNVHELPAHLDFFEKTAGFRVTQKKGNFVTMQSEFGQLLLNGIGDKLDKPVPRIPGVEIGIVVANVDTALAGATTFNWRITSGIVKQSWGVRDFRVLTPDGYYLRFTEGPDAKTP
jgi:hypothetical protein